MDEKKALRQALNLITRTPWVLVTAFSLKGWPDSAMRINTACKRKFPALANKINHKIFENYFPLNAYSDRYKTIVKNPKVALYYYDVTSKEMVQVHGYMEIVKDHTVRQAMWQPEWEQQCPDGIDGDEYVLQRFIGRQVQYYDGVSDSYKGLLPEEVKK